MAKLTEEQKKQAAADKKAADKAAADKKAADDKAAADKAKAETETVENNPTVKRQKAAKALRNKRAAEITKKQNKAAKKVAEQKAAGEKTADNKETKDTRKRFTDDKGRKFSFKFSASKTINIYGVSRKTSDLIEDEEVMLELIYGNSNLLQQIH